MQSPIFQRLVEEIKAKACFRPERVRDGRLDQRYRQRSIVHAHILNINTLVIVFCNLKIKRSRSSRNQPVKVITNHRVLDRGTHKVLMTVSLRASCVARQRKTMSNVQNAMCNGSLGAYFSFYSSCRFVFAEPLGSIAVPLGSAAVPSLQLLSGCSAATSAATNKQVKTTAFSVAAHRVQISKKKKRKGKARREEECGGA